MWPRSPWITPLLAALHACSAPAAREVPPAPERPAAEFLAEADDLFRARQYTRAGEAFQLVAREAERQGDVGTTVEACAMVARCYSIEADMAKGQFWLDRALARAEPGEPRGWTRAEQVRGIFQRERGDRDGALETFARLHEYCRGRGLDARAIDAAHHAALVAPLAEQVAWGEKGLAAARAVGDERWQAILWNNLGRTHEALGQPAEMLAAYERARHFHGRSGGEREVLLADWALGRGLRINGRLAQAEARLGDVLARAEERQRAQPGPGNLEWVGYSLWELGEVAAARGRPAEARERLGRALRALVDAGVERVWPEGVGQVRARLAELEGEG